MVKWNVYCVKLVVCDTVLHTEYSGYFTVLLSFGKGDEGVSDFVPLSLCNLKQNEAWSASVESTSKGKELRSNN